MKSIAISFCIGILYSFLTVLVGGWYFHFFPAVALTQALGLGFLAVLTDLTSSWFIRSRSMIHGLVILPLSFYCYFWLINLSSLLTIPATQAHLYSLSLLGFFAFLTYLFRCLLLSLCNNSKQWFSSVILVGFLVFLLVVKGTLTVILPFSWVDYLALKANPYTSKITSKNFDQEYLYTFFYPFSVPMEKGLARFSWLVDRPDFQSSNHVLMVVLDALRSQSVGARIKDSSVTPTIDRLKESGLNFENYYVQAPLTKPSTASFFTGLYLREHATFLGPNPDDSIEDSDLFYGQPLPDRFRTLAERLSDNDVETFGAVSIPHISSEYQFDQGFDKWFDPGKNSSERTDYAAVQRLLFWFQRERPQKSFVYLHLAGPHYPFAQSLYNNEYWKKTKYLSREGFKVPGKNLPHPEEMSRFTLPATKDKISDKQIEYLRHLYRAKLNLHDRKIVKPLLTGLKQIGAKNSSYIILSSDHGEELFDYVRFGHKRNLREPVISPPLILRYPGGDPSGTSRRMVESIDLTATILDWMNSDTEALSGSSFADEPRRSEDSQEAFVEIGKEIYLRRKENRKKINLRKYDLGVSVAVVRQGPWKFYHEYESGQDVLINLNSDPGEKTAITDRPDVTEHLRGRIFDELGSDSTFAVPPSPLLKGSETHSKNLQGLGYL